MKPSRLFARLTMVIVAMLVLAACGTPANQAAGGTGATASTGAAASAGAAGAASGGLPKLAKKDTYNVGFAQVVSDNPWRLAETKSMQDEAAKRGYQITVTDAGGDEAKQIADVDSLIAKKVDAIFLAPIAEKPMAQAVLKAKAAGIPVILLDRDVDQSLAKAGQDYVTVISSDFVDEGKRAAEWLIKTTSGTAKIVELEGTVGSSPAIDRKKGFHDALAGQAGMEILVSQTGGDFNRDKGRQVMETLIQSHPDLTAVYAHNDEMAIGAITALEAAGKTPGKDVIVVSVDGSRDALQSIIDGKMGATVECNPRFGPVAFDTLEKYAAGEQIPTRIVNPDNFFDITNAKDFVDQAY